MSEAWTDLERLQNHLWARLERGAAERHDPFRFAALATVGKDGAEARMVGLRRVSRRDGLLEVHSDMRTAKVSALMTDPRATLLFWDAASQEQLRVVARFDVHAGLDDRWHQVPPSARGNYGTDPAPGSPLPGPDAYMRNPARARFAALVGQVTGLGALCLAQEPHVRARFDGTDLAGSWVAP